MCDNTTYIFTQMNWLYINFNEILAWKVLTSPFIYLMRRSLPQNDTLATTSLVTDICHPSLLRSLAMNVSVIVVYGMLRVTMIFDEWSLETDFKNIHRQ